MRTVQGVTPDSQRSAVIGVVLSAVGIGAIFAGSYLLPVPQDGRFFVALTLIVFGILLAATGVIVFVLPAAFDYWRDAMAVTPASRTLF